MNSRLIIVVESLMFLFFCSSCDSRENMSASASVHAEHAINISVPRAVREFLEIQYPKTLEERQSFPEAAGSDFYPKYTLLFYCKIADWRDQQSPAWLVGYCIARSGQGYGPTNRLAFMHENGMGGDSKDDSPLAALPEKCAGDNAIAFELMPGTWAFAVTRYEGRHAYYDARIFTLAPQPKELLRYASGEPDARKRCWYSTLYFLDADEDGCTDVLADRIVRDFEQKVMWKEYALYLFDKGKIEFAQGSKISEDRFKQLLSDRADVVPSIRQEGIPFERGFTENLPVVEGAP